MFLKRLEVIGFKSFADRVGIDFVPGVTAVVGPNGSGKSNVTDAIRWVLGEQSAKSLRGIKMEDIIFAGSDSRKPLNFAEVSLILDNEDGRLPISYNEVSVTRRVYRSGDSEYLLNKQQCRLKDITDLFLDSGLGKEAFSIISQGRVDEILNSRPDDRRSIFEEAAGVLKYKQRRKKAEHKLFETDDNLHRVLDILHELDKRIEPLHIQASAAEDYLKMSGELKDMDLAVLVHDMEQLKRSIEQIVSERKNVLAQEQAYSKQIAEKEETITAFRQKVSNLDSLLDESQHQLVEVSAEAERFEGRKVLVAEKRMNANTQLEKLKQSLQKAESSLSHWEQAKVTREGQLTERQMDLQELKRAVKQLEDLLNRSSSEIHAEIEQWKNTYIDRLNEEATVKNEVKNITHLLAEQAQNEVKISSQSIEMAEELQTLQKEQQRTVKSHDEVTKEVARKLAEYEACQKDANHAKAQYDKQQEMLFKGYQHLQQLKARKETLAELEADFSGFYQGVKAVLVAREKNQLNGIHGAVAELIHVDGEYAKALETALGAAMQHIVTETDGDARKAISWLKQQKAGRATFLPKNVIKSRKIADSVLQTVNTHPSFINTADELATYNPSIRTIAESLLGHVLVARDLQGASQIAKACNYRYRVVTLDGDVVNTGGSLTGGSVKQQASLFSRKAELEGLSEQLVQMEQSIGKAEKIVADWKKQFEEKSTQLEELRLQGEELRSKEVEYSAHLREMDTTIKRLSLRVSMFTDEQQDATGRKTTLEQQLESFAKRQKELTEELTEINRTVEELNALQQQSETKRDALKEEYALKRSQLAVLNEQVTQLKTAVAEAASQVEQAKEEVKYTSNEMDWLLNGGDLNGQSEEEIQETIERLRKQRETLVQTVERTKTERMQMQQQVEQIDLDLKELQRVHQGMLDGIRNYEVKLSRLDVEYENLAQQMETDYDITFEDALLQHDHDTDIEAARRKVKLLKQSIAELGTVNLSAIEEYATVSERHTFLTNQRNDLLEAKETLHEAIREMDEEMTSRFKETFFETRAHFQSVFRELFGGGHADLELIDPDNLLETGIEIVAQPPGKKLQRLSLLSGGERALTAIALLFAILKTRPVPFCILDEVEAALDESNVNRYSQYLKRYSQETQFIVITHRKGTMEGADVLYGITMQESGVSKLVSVKLEQEVPVPT
ncbi:chromosome segregation protein SMC [Rummeliibacillus stabekisii]|uniref:Chromosome partition protein Smc n=1 Tax=Rummeliibacillus stabekisii TaxID=241244 RepID=A0A143H9H1_9BACL|nr:chromosome segregation protein SMC [Rummeliibacillus stabekisii]AMW98393.1 chromosome segregation protein SMC [Rummeliibacillus stabekisii]